MKLRFEIEEVKKESAIVIDPLEIGNSFFVSVKQRNPIRFFPEFISEKKFNFLFPRVSTTRDRPKFLSLLLLRNSYINTSYLYFLLLRNRISFEKEILNVDEETRFFKSRPSSFSFASKRIKSNLVQERGNVVKNKRIPVSLASKDSLEILGYWNSAACGCVHNQLGTKTVEKSLWVLEKEYLPKYGLETILRTIDDFKYVVKNPSEFKDSYIVKNTTLLMFLKPMKDYRKDKLKEKRGKRQSWFDKLVVPGSINLLKKGVDKNKFLTNKLISLFEKRITGRKGTKWPLSDVSKFTLAAKRLKEFMKTKRLEKHIKNCSESTYITVLFQALISRFGSVSKISIGNLCSNYTWNVVVPTYVAEQYEVS